MLITQDQLTEMRHRDLSIVDGAILHHSDADKTLDITEIAAMEKKDQDFVTVGYHAYVKCVDVDKDLWVVQIGRPIDVVPAAALGYNSRSIDICIGGNYHPGAQSWTDTVSDRALHAAAAWILEAKRKLPNLKYLDGHRDVATWHSILAAENMTPTDVATACPGDRLYARLHDLRVLTGLHTRPVD